ncbi:hypothetical protein EVAR_62231_1 [Eumeta japonica]|uniref:Uncharacterized protein n=1 Tax=Eumeta variegata TaxID=151549 RepID=A0A4C1ZC83_EUMVA|nr:hypothetical protein EVAR_62231_1 [Eumeta japonica]
MRSLRSMCGVSRKDRYGNSGVIERCGLKKDVVTKVERGRLRWFGHLERMSEGKLTKQIYRTKMCNRNKGIESECRVPNLFPVPPFRQGRTDLAFYAATTDMRADYAEVVQGVKVQYLDTIKPDFGRVCWMRFTRHTARLTLSSKGKGSSRFPGSSS